MGVYMWYIFYFVYLLFLLCEESLVAITNNNTSLDNTNTNNSNIPIFNPINNSYLKIKGFYDIGFKYGETKKIFLSDDFKSNNSSGFIFENSDNNYIFDGFDFNQDFSFEIIGGVNNEINAFIVGNDETETIDYKAVWTPSSNKFFDSIIIANEYFLFDKHNIYLNENNSKNDVLGIKIKNKFHNFQIDSFVNIDLAKREEKVFNGYSSEETISIHDVDYYKYQFYDLKTKTLDKIEIFREIENSDYLYDIEIITPYKTTTGRNAIITNRFIKLDSSLYRFDNEKGILKVNTTLGKKTILFFSKSGEGVPINSSADKPFNRLDNLGYTMLTNMNSENIIGLSGEMYNNFIVLTDTAYENIKNPWELRNYYPIPDNIDNNSLVIKLMHSDNSIIKNENEHFYNDNGSFNNTGNFYINFSESYIEFENIYPFNNKNTEIKNEYIYEFDNNYIENNRDEISKYLFEYKYKTKKTDSFYLRSGIVIDSVVVKINNKTIREDNYEVDYEAGILKFDDSFIVNFNDEIVVSYKYKDSGSGLFGYNVGSRFSYNFNDKNDIGLSAVYGGNFLDSSTIDINNNSSANLLLMADTSLSIPSLFNIQNDNIEFNIQASYAYSIYNENTKNKAFIFDMSTYGESLSLDISESRKLYFTRNPVLENEGLSLGFLYYIDLRKYNNITQQYSFYNLNEIDKIKRESPDQIKSFKSKVGAYYSDSGGHKIGLNKENSSALIFDYEFSSATKSKYVSVVQGFDINNGYDISSFNELEIICSLGGSDNNSSPDKINLMIEAGSPTEDFDGDGIFDSESSEADANGLLFNYKEQSRYEKITKMGQGRRGATSDEIENGNGIRDSEDLNDDDIFYDTDNTVALTRSVKSRKSIIIPSLDYYNKNKDDFSSSENYSIEHIGGNFFKIKIKIQNFLDLKDKSIIKNSKALRVSLYSESSQKKELTGRFILSHLTFRKISITDIFIDNIKTENNNLFNASIINSDYDSIYNSQNENRLIDDSEWIKIYNDLHGKIKKDKLDEFSESSLRLEYKINGREYKNNKKDAKEALIYIYPNDSEFYNLSSYKELNFFIYKELESTSKSEKFIIRFGESTNRYYEIKFDMKLLNRRENNKNKWNKVTIHFDDLSKTEAISISINNGDKYKNNDSIIIDGYKCFFDIASTGHVSLNRIKMFGFGVLEEKNLGANYSAGTLWINEAYASDDILKHGMAWNIGGDFLYKGFEINNFSIVSNFNIIYEHKEVGQGFAYIDDTPSQYELNFDYINTSAILLGVLGVSAGFGYSDDNLMGYEYNDLYSDDYIYKFIKDFNFSLSLVFPSKYSPKLYHSYLSSFNEKNNLVLKEDDSIYLQSYSSYSRAFDIREVYEIKNIFGIENLYMYQDYYINANIEKRYNRSVENISEDEIYFDAYDGFLKEDDNIFNNDKSYDEELHDARYLFSREQGGSLNIIFIDILSVSFSIAENINYSSEYDNFFSDYFNDKYDSDYFSTFATLWNNKLFDELDENGNRINEYLNNRGYNTQQSISTGYIPFLGSVEINMYESYSESDFKYDETKNYSFNEDEVYADFKDTYSFLAVDLSFSLEFSDFIDSPFLNNINVYYIRDASMAESDVFDNGDFSVARYADTLFPIVFNYPFAYIDLPFENSFRDIISGSGNKDKARRHKAFNQLYDVYDFNENKYYHHSDYYLDMTLYEEYSLEFNFKYISYINWIIPNSFIYTHSMNTSRDSSIYFEQIEDISVLAERDIKISDIIKLSKNNILNIILLAYDIEYILSKNYKDKTVENSFIFNSYTYIPIGSHDMRFRFGYEYSAINQHMNFNDGNYMGMGDEYGTNYNNSKYEDMLNYMTAVILSEARHLFRFDISYTYSHSISTGALVRFIKNNIDFSHTFRMNIPFFIFEYFDNENIYNVNNIINSTSSDYFDSQNANNTLDKESEFFIIEPSYIFTVYSQKYMSFNSVLDLPIVLTKYFKTSSEYKNMNRYDIDMGFNFLFSLTIKL